MAKKKPIVTLSPEKVVALKQGKADIPELKKELEALKKVGIDVSSVESQIQWAEETIDTLLSTFTEEGAAAE